MHVCDINNFYSPRGGGVKTYHDQKLRFFLENPQHEYTLVYAGETEKREQLNRRVRVISLPGTRMSADYHFILNAVRLRRELDRFKPDVVELGEPYLLPWVARVASIDRPWPLVGFWHADFPRSYVQRPISRVHPLAGRASATVAWWYARRTYGPLAAVFASSNPVAADLRERGFNPVYETPLAVDTHLFHPGRRDLALRRANGIDDDSTLFIFPHRLTEEKGLCLALDAFVEIAREHPAALVIAGTGPGEPIVQKYAAGHPSIRYLGYIRDPQRMAGWYASSDLIFSLCPFETFGLATLEGIASGCAVIGTDRGIVGDMVARSGAGITVRGEQSGALAAAALTLLRNRPKLAECRERGVDYVRCEYSWDRTFARMLECYRRVLSAPSTRGAASRQAPG